ncbi:helix-turn-helix domain-containing protein [Marinobacter alexandrii]|uniref:transcriptional regulator n=1 Tax=Marinobacter alexandrii TaxID=2570351 RepID=UPI001FFEB1E3|nr:helix-turn-helix domain-containing protein [Marinobacter alexandrii]MCK2149488.1 helix-turn-helix domain-containing protein [Marinobacter alexandrii]
MSITALKKSIRLAGSQSALAAKCGTKQSNIWNWLHRDGRVPAEYVIAVCTATDFKVTPHEVRPDIYPNKKDALPSGSSRTRSGVVSEFKADQGPASESKEVA